MSHTREVAVVWGFGTTTVSNSLGSTGAVANPYNTFGYGDAFTFSVETDAGATCSYQIRVGRTSAGPWTVLSSGTLTSNAMDVVQIPGPLNFLSPRIKTLTSTSVGVIVRANAV